MTDFKTLQSAVLDSWKKQAEWREQAESDFAFVSGHQWTDTEKAALEEASRVPIVFNRTAVIISAVTGSEINNRTEVRFIPREIGDVKPNEVLTAGAEWFRDQSDAEDADSQAFYDLIVCGMGATETTLNFDEDPEGVPEIRRIPPMEFGWDHNDNTKGLTKARYFFRVMQMSVADAKERFPDLSLSEIDATWITTGGQPTPHINNPGEEYETDQAIDNASKDTVTVVQVQYRKREKYVEYVDPQTGERAEMPRSKWRTIEKMTPPEVQLPPNREINKTVWTQYFLGALDILDENQPDPDGSTLNAMTGSWDVKEKQWYGLLRSMRDPQKYANKWLSQGLHIMNANSKGGVMVEEGAVSNPREFEESWSASDAVTWVKAGAMGRIQEKSGAQFPNSMMQLTEFAVSSIRDASGVNMELLGLRDQNQPGVLEYQRRQAAMSTLAGFFDSLRHYRKRQGTTILHFIVNYLAPMGAMARIVSGEQVRYVSLATEAGTRRYDVIVDDAPQAPNEKEKSWSVIQAMMPMLERANLGLEDWADILDYSPLPSSFAEKVRAKAMEQQKQGPSPEQQAAMQLEMQKTQSEIAENMANAQYDQIRAQQVATETQLAPAKVAADLFQPIAAPRGM